MLTFLIILGFLITTIILFVVFPFGTIGTLMLFGYSIPYTPALVVSLLIFFLTTFIFRGREK